VPKLAGAAWAVFEAVTAAFRPSAARPQYAIDICDLARLWVHEHCRVSHDRLVADAERHRFSEIVASAVKKKVGADVAVAAVYGDFDQRVSRNFALVAANSCASARHAGGGHALQSLR
jgi:hypothetical protein